LLHKVKEFDFRIVSLWDVHIVIIEPILDVITVPF